MDQETLVDRLHESINRLLTELVARGQDVLAAAWAKTSEFGSPSLYLVSPRAEDGLSLELRRVIQSILRSAGDPRLQLSDVRLLGPSDLRGQELLLVAQLAGSDGVPRPFTGYFGGMPIYGTALVYAVPKAAPARPPGN
jgi:hypothetical protein